MSSAQDRDYWDDRARAEGRTACTYRNPISDIYEQPLRWDAFTRLCPVMAGMTVADVGCGVGRWSMRIADLGCDVYASDISDVMISLAEPHPRVRYRVAAADELDFADGMFDVIVSFTVLQHITDPGVLGRSLQNVRRMLKPDGRLFVLEYSPLRSVPSEALSYMRFRTYHEWVDVITEQGFELARSTGVRFFGYRLYAIAQRVRGLRRNHHRVPPSKPSAQSVPASPASRPVIRAALAAIWIAEKIAGRTPWLELRSDVHAFVFTKKVAADQQAAPAATG